MDNAKVIAIKGYMESRRDIVNKLIDTNREYGGYIQERDERVSERDLIDKTVMAILSMDIVEVTSEQR